VWNSLNEFDWLTTFAQIFNACEEEGNLTRISILRVLLQMARISRDAIDVILPHRAITDLLQSYIKSDDIILSAMCM